MTVLTITGVYNGHLFKQQDFLCRKVKSPQPRDIFPPDYFESEEQLFVCVVRQNKRVRRGTVAIHFFLRSFVCFGKT